MPGLPEAKKPSLKLVVSRNQPRSRDYSAARMDAVHDRLSRELLVRSTYRWPAVQHRRDGGLTGHTSNRDARGWARRTGRSVIGGAATAQESARVILPRLPVPLRSRRWFALDRNGQASDE